MIFFLIKNYIPAQVIDEFIAETCLSRQFILFSNNNIYSLSGFKLLNVKYLRHYKFLFLIKNYCLFNKLIYIKMCS